MPVREGPLKQMTTSGHCQWPTATFGHNSCKKKDCTCLCHTSPNFVSSVPSSATSSSSSSVPTASSAPLAEPGPRSVATSAETVSAKPKLQLKKRKVK